MDRKFDSSSFYAGIFVAIVAITLLIAVNRIDNEADCPQEDSCYADYYDGSWHIIEGDRP